MQSFPTDQRKRGEGQSESERERERTIKEMRIFSTKPVKVLIKKSSGPEYSREIGTTGREVVGGVGTQLDFVVITVIKDLAMFCAMKPF